MHVNFNGRCLNMDFIEWCTYQNISFSSIFPGHDKLLCTYMDVYVLRFGSIGSWDAEISMVEKIYHKATTGTYGLENLSCLQLYMFHSIAYEIDTTVYLATYRIRIFCL